MNVCEELVLDCICTLNKAAAILARVCIAHMYVRGPRTWTMARVRIPCTVLFVSKYNVPTRTMEYSCNPPRSVWGAMQQQLHDADGL